MMQNQFFRMEQPNGFLNPQQQQQQQQQILQHQMQQGMRSGINSTNIGIVPGTNSGYPNMMNLNTQGGNPFGGFSAPNNMMVGGNSQTASFQDMQNNSNQRNPWAPVPPQNSNINKPLSGNIGGLNQNPMTGSTIPQLQNEVFMNNNFDPQQTPNSSNFLNPNLGQMNPSFQNSNLSSSQLQQNQQIQQQQQMILQLMNFGNQPPQTNTGQTNSNIPANNTNLTTGGPPNQRSTNPNSNFPMFVGGNNIPNPSSYMGLPLSTNMKGFL
jgi:hypothetical protein